MAGTAESPLVGRVNALLQPLLGESAAPDALPLDLQHARGELLTLCAWSGR